MDVDANLPEGGDGVVLPDGNDAETKARRLGWVPKEDFRGDPDKHRSAEEFLKRGEEILPILQRDNKRLHENFGKVEKQLKETQETLQTYSEFAKKAAEREYKKSLRELETKLDAAIELADVSQARQLRKEIAELDGGEPAPKPKPEPVGEPDAPKVDPEVQTWIEQNQWFNNSASLRTYAVEEFGELEKRYPGKSRTELLAEVKQRTVDRFPDKFGINPKRDGAAAVASPTGEGTRRKTGKTYDDLPAEAKKACDKFVRTIPKYTRDQYVKDYEWDS
jgi:hypothetical protein